MNASGVMSTYAGNYGGGSPGNAFDGDTNTKVCCKAHPVVVEFPNPTPIDAYSFTTGNDVPARDPVQWTLEASEDALSDGLPRFLESACHQTKQKIQYFLFKDTFFKCM